MENSDSRAAVVASTWFAAAIISACISSLRNNADNKHSRWITVFVAFIITFAVTFGLEGMRQESPAAKAKVQISSELGEIKTTVSELTKKVDAIQKSWKHKSLFWHLPFYRYFLVILFFAFASDPFFSPLPCLAVRNLLGGCLNAYEAC